MNRTSSANGQVLPVLLAVVALAIVALLLTQRVNRTISQETRLVNAADAAAYSAAVWSARRLNLMAYTNRAMLANHIAVGHLVAYISWLRYVDNSAHRIARYTAYLPYVGAATRLASQTARTALMASEKMSWGYINGVDALHRLMQLAQFDAQRELQSASLNRVMQAVVEVYDEDFRVNNNSDIRQLPQPYATGVQALLASQQVAALTRLQTARPGRDGGYFTGLLSQTINHNNNLRRWLKGQESASWPRYGSGGRAWQRSIFKLIRFRKQGATNRAPLADAGGWRSVDRFQVSTFSVRKWGWRGWSTLGQGSADADRLAGGYSGITRYTRLRRRGQSDYQFSVSALVSAPIPDAEAQQAIQSHLSMAEVSYRVPDDCTLGCPRDNDPATLFNPYWEAGLAPTELPSL